MTDLQCYADCTANNSYFSNQTNSTFWACFVCSAYLSNCLKCANSSFCLSCKYNDYYMRSDNKHCVY